MKSASSSVRSMDHQCHLTAELSRGRTALRPVRFSERLDGARQVLQGSSMRSSVWCRRGPRDRLPALACGAKCSDQRTAPDHDWRTVPGQESHAEIALRLSCNSSGECKQDQRSKRRSAPCASSPRRSTATDLESHNPINGESPRPRASELLQAKSIERKGSQSTDM
jgi:hypothetical protein